MRVKLRLILYHLDVLACGAIAVTYFWMTRKAETEGHAVTEGEVE